MYHISQNRSTGKGLNLSIYRTLMKKICKKINLYEPTLKNSLKTEKYIRKKNLDFFLKNVKNSVTNFYTGKQTGKYGKMIVIYKKKAFFIVLSLLKVAKYSIKNC